MINKSSKIYISGHTGLVGSAVLRRLKKDGYRNILLADHKSLDLTRQQETERFFLREKPEYVFHAAAKVGGILANATSPADFIYQNIMISTNIINSSYKSHVKKLINLGSSCIYPKHSKQPIREKYFMSGILEPTNEAYAIAKISAIKLCKFYNEQFGTNYISVMPTNLYGTNDNFDLKTSHVLPALLRKFHDARTLKRKSITVWGTGNPRREFLHVDDLADALVFLMQNKNYNDIGEFVNIGTGVDITIKDLAFLIKNIIGYTGQIVFDTSKPDGTHQKLLDLTRLHKLGWKHSISLEEGIRSTYKWYIEHHT